MYSFGVMVLEFCAFPERPIFFDGHSNKLPMKLHEDALSDADKIEDNMVWKITMKCLNAQENDRINSTELLNMCEDLYKKRNEQHVNVQPLDGSEITRRIGGNESVTIESKELDAIIQNPRRDGQIGRFEKLGDGGFGYTFKFENNSGIPLVLKMSAESQSNCEKPDWFRESFHTMKLDHVNIIKYYDKHILYKNTYFCVMEYGGSSVHSIYFEKSKMNIQDICEAMVQVSRGLHFLHYKADEMVIHRDVRSENVTLSASGIYKLIDFGISSKRQHGLDSNINSDIKLGNELWKPPDYSTGKKIYCYN